MDVVVLVGDVALRKTGANAPNAKRETPRQDRDKQRRYSEASGYTENVLSGAGKSDPSNEEEEPNGTEETNGEKSPGDDRLQESQVVSVGEESGDRGDEKQPSDGTHPGARRKPPIPVRAALDVRQTRRSSMRNMIVNNHRL